MRSSSRTKRIVCVIQLELGEDQYFLNFHVPVVAYARDQILRDCDGKLTDQDGYVFMTSKSTDIEGQMVPLLKCLSHTTLKIRTKYILDFTEDRVSNETYENYFNNLRKSFAVIKHGDSCYSRPEHQRWTALYQILQSILCASVHKCKGPY